MSDRRSAIENMMYHYAWTYDRNELDDIWQVFTIDAQATFRDSGLKVGRNAIVAEMRRRRANYPEGTLPWHVISNVYITDETPESARVRSWYTFFVQAPDGTQEFSNVGFYDDLFVLDDGVWRVSRRHIKSPHHP